MKVILPLQQNQTVESAKKMYKTTFLHEHRKILNKILPNSIQQYICKEINV